MNRKQVTRQNLYEQLLTLLHGAHSGHIGSCLSVLDILAVLILHIKKEGDTVLLSKGHAAPALYTVLHAAGKLTDTELRTFHHDNTHLPAHPPYHFLTEDIPFATGSLGHGLSLTAGMAHALKLKHKKGHVYCIMSDGECNEGQVWEAAQYAAHFKLHNLTVIIDVNGWQAFGKTKDVLGVVSTDKWKAFGWSTETVDGHDWEKLTKTITALQKGKETKPTVVLCTTVKGKGLPFFEDKLESHYLPLTDEQFTQALEHIKHL